MLTLRATLYMVALESDFPAGEDASFVTRDGTVLHRTSKEFLATAALQGTAQLNDGRIVMVDGREKGPPRWKVSPHDYAVGFSGCKLVPFRSVAVDRRVVPLGSQLIIEATRGMKLPNGKLHDGVWYAVDTGSRIRNNRVDLFVGAGKTPLSIPIEHGIKHLQPLDVRIGARMQGCPTA
jgi:3D (Asp-Asp-Asp) domain-containing protein